jgi:L-threonylcarbamoyladenylate synthase
MMNDTNFSVDIHAACKVLQQGGIILYPTDTVWGIGCDATNEDAVKKVLELKKRTEAKSLIVLLDSVAKLPYYVEDIPPIAYDLIETATEPLTVVYSKARNLATNVIAEDGSVAIRITMEAFSAQLCNRFRKPLVSTSANFSGEPAPSTFKEISPDLKQGVDYIVKYGQENCQKHKPSSIIKLGEGGLIQILRN